MKRISGSLVVCVGAGVFTAGALFHEPDRSRLAPPIPPAPTGVVTYGSGAAGSGGGTAATLRIADFSFGAVAAAPGAPVSVLNQDGATHTVTAEDGAFEVDVDGGSSASFVAPATPGTYAYFCVIHPDMRGTLVVR